ncbi:efflux transporter, RND family, MFP subunit [Stenotrophomonas sp. SKA14]|uniref:efflux RND transporter periplasmic adaptor subunit n=1 Tax=Stenotrophomonas TaxID=40323 RepID=UPI00018FEB84|nr:efflux RND transporter periplasmic adaptor subunit [Stenotrophomonas sp. SKA14]EED38825.1 efflux transporter, RND family, MFP subunit [Stenotrophomonas sp. SKA14]
MVVIVAVAIALLARWLAGHGGGSGGGRPTASVSVEKVARMDVPVTITAIGTVTPLATATVRSQQAGVLGRILFREGQQVQQGQVLAEVDPRPFQAALAQARADQARDQAQLAAARVDLARYRTLLAQDSIASQQVDTQAALVHQLQGTVQADAAAVQTAELNLGYTSIRSPVTGVVGLRLTDIGNYVTAQDTTGIAVVTQQDPIDIAFAIPQGQLGLLGARGDVQGDDLVVQALAQEGATLLGEGRLQALDNVIDTSTGTVKAKARFANPDGKLFPNQFVNVVLQVRSLPQAMVVPVSAVRHGTPGDFVFVLQPGQKVRMQVVTTGPMVGQKMAILGGLKGDESVVTAGADGLQDGSQVRVGGGAPSTGTGKTRSQHKKGSP